MIEFNEELHEYRWDGKVVDSVTQILQAEGFVDTTWYDDYSRTRGKYVHKACALWDRGKLDAGPEALDPVIIPYLAAWTAFLKDSKFKIIAIEEPLCGFTFAGTPDRIGFIGNEEVILDIKTGKPEAWTALQLAGYEVLRGRSVKRMAVQLTVEGKYKTYFYNDRTDRQIFMAALAVHNWKKNHLRNTHTHDMGSLVGSCHS